MKHKLSVRFKELARANISKSREVVISRNIDGGISIAQKINFVNEGREQYLFMKNSIMTDEEGLRGLQSAIEKAIDMIERSQ